MSNLPPPRLVIASNTSTGTSIISSSSTLTPFHPFGPNATGFTTLFSTTSFPASNTAPLPLLPQNQSLDQEIKALFSVPLISRLSPLRSRVLPRTRLLPALIPYPPPSSDRVKLFLSAYIYIYFWINKTDQWCRMLCVMLDAEPVIVEGSDGKKVLEAVFIPHKPAHQ
ncbi:hypothetical protein BKA61DRAFT_733210 [Leptodontidium sp. MPI-SDFR-AT-0119]|nr:hypothetical protein BKA61DRAFT_733210 [Leptodontidium sp. MPI-SDFR-AT-0119]